MDDFSDRVRRRRKELALTQAELAAKARIPQSTIGQIENGRNKSTTKLLELAAALETTPEFLMFGKDGGVPVRPTPQISKDTVTFRHREVYVSCGGGKINADFPEIIRTLEVPKDRMVELFGHLDTAKLDIIGISGDSMEPTLPQKALAFVDTRITEYTGDGIYAFWYIDGVYMKRLQKVPGKLIAHSDNPNYSSFEITPDSIEQFKIIAKFVGVLPLDFKEL